MRFGWSNSVPFAGYPFGFTGYQNAAQFPGFNQTWNNNNPGNSFTVNSPIGGAGNSLTFAGTGRTTLAGASAYDGGTVVNSGTLALGVNNALAAAGSRILRTDTLSVVTSARRSTRTPHGFSHYLTELEGEAGAASA